MGTIYDKKIFSELFDSMRVIDEIVDIVEYTLAGECETELNLHISPADEYASIMLMRPDKESCFFDVIVDRLKKIVYDRGVLKFYKEGNLEKPALTLAIGPKISLGCRAEAPRSGD